MRLTHLLTNEVVVLRLSDLGNDKMALSTVTSIRCEIQPIEDNKSEIADGVFGKEFTFYSDGRVTLVQGDTLRDSDGNLYTVKSGGVSNRQHGRISYTKVIIELTA